MTADAPQPERAGATDGDGRALTVPLHPALLFGLALGLGLLAQRLLPMAPPVAAEALAWRLAGGGILFALAAALGGWAVLTLRRQRTPADFGQAVTALVDAGPFRRSRNPLYLALLLAFGGCAVVLANPWLALLLPALALALDRLVVRREEAFLDALFGESYRRYRGRVRRWL